MKLKKDRIGYLDIARGITIILMVIFHYIPIGLVRDLVYSFHMPLFVIVSGYFFKEEKTLKNLLKEIFLNILIPYIVIIIFVYIITSISSEEFNLKYLLLYILSGNSNAKLGPISEVGVLWFIPFLSVIKLVFWLLKKLSKNNDFILFIMVVLNSLLGLILSYNKIYLPWSIDASISCVCFYYVGYTMNKYKVLDYIFKYYGIHLIIFSCYIITFLFGNIEIAIRSYPFGLVCFITAILGSVIIFYISKVIEKYLDIPTKVLTWYGKNSIYILIFHYMEMNLINYNSFDESIFLLVVVKLIIITSLTFSYLIIKNYRKFCLGNVLIN